MVKIAWCTEKNSFDRERSGRLFRWGKGLDGSEFYVHDKRQTIFRLCLSVQMQSWIKLWFALVWLQLRLRFVFSVLVFALIGTLTWRSKCRKTISARSFSCATLIKLAVFYPDQQRNALSVPLSHHGLTTITHSYTVRLQLNRHDLISSWLITIFIAKSC